jgi:hypothetical protein
METKKGQELEGKSLFIVVVCWSDRPRIIPAPFVMRFETFTYLPCLYHFFYSIVFLSDFFPAISKHLLLYNERPVYDHYDHDDDDRQFKFLALPSNSSLHNHQFNIDGI